MLVLLRGFSSIRGETARGIVCAITPRPACMYVCRKLLRLERVNTEFGSGAQILFASKLHQLCFLSVYLQAVESEPVVETVQSTFQTSAGVS